MQVFGFIKNFDIENDELTVKLKDLSDSDKFIVKSNLGNGTNLFFDDGRTITVDQRKKIFAMFSEIGEYLGYTTVNVEELMKIGFIKKMQHPIWFSLSNCSIEIAKNFLEFIISFCIKEKIPFATKVFDEIQQSYSLRIQLLKNRICFVCGKQNADVDHVDTIGSGRNRRHVNQVGYNAWTVCRIHHTERHKIGVKKVPNKTSETN